MTARTFCRECNRSVVDEGAGHDCEVQTADPRPGFYYVTAQDGPRYCLMAGPYPTHQKALGLVDDVRRTACEHDGRGHFMGWGTMRSESDKGPGSFQKAGLLPLLILAFLTACAPCITDTHCGGGYAPADTVRAK